MSKLSASEQSVLRSAIRNAIRAELHQEARANGARGGGAAGIHKGWSRKNRDDVVDLVEGLENWSWSSK